MKINRINYGLISISGYHVDQSGSMLNIAQGIWRQGKSREVNVVVKSLRRQHYENFSMVN